MLKLVFPLFILGILGLLTYDIAQSGSFSKSQIYQFLQEKGILKSGELFMTEAQKSFSTTKGWAERNVPVYYNKTYIYLKPYLNLGQDLTFVLKSNIISFIQHTGIFAEKNFPAFQNYVSVVLQDTITLAKESALVFSKHLQNYTETAVQYANNILSQR